MTARLTRLRSVRNVELRIGLTRLAAAQRNATQAAATTRRVDHLIADLPDGPSRQAVAATRLALTAARTRLLDRCADTATQQRTAAEAVQRLKTRRDVVDTALAARRASQP